VSLAVVGFPGAPRPLGYDEQGRQILTFVEGEGPADGPYRLPDARLRSATSLIRAFHDATAASPLRADQEVVCHGDLGPHNTVFRGEQAVALIDFRGSAHASPTPETPSPGRLCESCGKQFKSGEPGPITVAENRRRDHGHPRTCTGAA
jgi:hypothetical protein